jgi:hypothetical protein
MIDTNYGIQIPALLHSVVETFSREGVDQSIFSDRELLSYINKELLDKTLKPHNSTPADLGLGLGTHVEYSGEADQNKDPFIMLTPAKTNM